MKTEPARQKVSRVSILSTGHPRVEIGDIVAGPGAVYTLVEDALVVLERAGPGAELTGPFRVDAAAVAALLAALRAELSTGSSHLNPAALRTTVDLLARSLAGPQGCHFDEELAPACPVPTWDEANADVC
jgi:hypothetical protein